MKRCCHRDGLSSLETLEPVSTRAHFISNICKERVALQDIETYEQPSGQKLAEGLCFSSARVLNISEWLFFFLFFLLKAVVCHFINVKLLSQGTKTKSLIGIFFYNCIMTKQHPRVATVLFVIGYSILGCRNNTLQL